MPDTPGHASPARGLRALVVGGAGFVGSNLTRRLLADGAESVLVVDNLLSAEAENLPDDGRVELRVGSIADDAVLADLPADRDVIFHLATYHGNQSSIADPLADHDNNLITTLKLFRHLAEHDVRARVVYASTGCALAAKGEGPAEPVAEDGPIPLDFDSPYQISKVVGEMYALYFGRQGLPVVRARFQNVYGPGEVLGAGRWRGTPATIWRNVVPTFVYRALKGLPLLVDGGGRATRDFVYVGDVVDGLIRCGTAPGIEGDVFNLASGDEVTILRLAEQINEIAGNSAGVEVTPARGWDRSIHRVGSTAKAARILGFEASVSLEDGLRRTVEWMSAELPRVEACITKHAEHYAVTV